MENIKTFEEVEEILESLVHYRFTKKELEEVLTEKFGKKIELHCTTDANKDFDYMFTFNVYGDDEEDIDYYIDADIYYLKMRDKKSLYITEVNVERY